MRGVTLAVVGAAAVILLAIAILMRGGEEGPLPGADIGVAPRPRSGAGPVANMGTGGGAQASGETRSARVEDRLGQLRADYEKRMAQENPAVARRELPTASLKAERMRERARSALVVEDSDDDDPEEIAEVRETLHNNQDPDERIGAILMLTGDEGPESMQLLLEAMDDPDPEVRLAVVEALGDRVEELTPGLLAKPLRDSDAEVRFEAVSVLGDMDDPEALQLVQTALQDPDEDVRTLAEGIMDFSDDSPDGDAPHAAQPAGQ